MIEHDDPVLQALANLPLISSDPVRTERVRARCHRQLSRRDVSPLNLLDAAALAALACYLTVVLADAARLAGLF